MKKDIHPQYNQAKVTCSCGNTFEVGSTIKTIDVEVCSACHPFYTGVAKFIDTAGRVDKFQAKVKKAEELKAKSQKDAKKSETDQPKAKKSK